MKILKFLKISQYFKSVFSGSNYEFKKPDGKKLKKILSFKKKNKILIIGDSEADEMLAKIHNLDLL